MKAQPTQNGKLPPAAIDLENAVLGAVMIDDKGLDEFFTLIKFKEVFYKIEHQYIFQALSSLYNSSSPVDLLTVSNELRKAGKLDSVGGNLYLIGLTQKVSSAAHIEYHCRVLIEKYVKRGLISLGSEMIESGYNEQTDVFDLMDKSQTNLEAIGETIAVDSFSSSDEIGLAGGFIELYEHIKRISNSAGEITGVPTGIKAIDDATNGWQSSDLVIQAARPGMGKTSLAMTHLLAAAKAGIPSVIFSIEMNQKQLMARLTATETNFHVNQLLREGLKKESYWKSFHEAVERLGGLPIKIETPSSLTVFDFRMRAKLLKRKYNIGLIIVDYMQLMKSGKNHKDENLEVQEISRALKSLAKEIDVPVIALSQLSRASVQRGAVKRPMLTDLRGSGSIEQDADIVMFIHRPEYYGMEPDFDVINHNQNTEFIFAKHRNGALGIVGGFFDKNKTKFVDFQTSEPWHE